MATKKTARAVWITGPNLRARWGDMANSTFYERLRQGLIPTPKYPFGPGKPYWLIDEIERLEAGVKEAA